MPKRLTHFDEDLGVYRLSDPPMTQAELIQALGQYEDRYVPKTFGEYLIRARERAGLTQRDVVEMLGISQSNIAQYEKNVMLPKPSFIAKFAKIIKASGFTYEDIKQEFILHKYKPRNRTLGETIRCELSFAGVDVHIAARECGISVTRLNQYIRNDKRADWRNLYILSKLANSKRLAELAKAEQNMSPNDRLVLEEYWKTRC